MNVLIILADQLRYDAVGYVSSWVRTPNIDGLARSGVRFLRAYAQSPQCQPSRASLLTGRYPTAHRVWWNFTPLGVGERTIGNYFRDMGYRTGYFGKLHVTDVVKRGFPVLAERLGFQELFEFDEWSGRPGRAREEFEGVMRDPCWTGRFSSVVGQHDHMVVDMAIEFIRRSSSPFLAVVGFHGPHPPYAAPPPFCDFYDPRDMVIPDRLLKNVNGYSMGEGDWRRLKSQYFGVVSWIDAEVGRLLGECSGDTVVVFLSDHGDILGDHGLFSKGSYAYDGVVRVPLVVRYPGCVPGVREGVVELVGVLPMLVRLCGGVVGEGVQGRDVELDGVGSALSFLGFRPKQRLRMFCGGGWKYWVRDDREWLFDLVGDPGELENIGDLGKLGELRWRLLRGLIGAEDKLPVPNLQR